MTEKKNKRIGFLSYWGWGRGMCYVTRCYAQMIQDEFDVFILKQGTNPIAEEFQTIKAHVTEYPNYNVDLDFYVNWVKDNKLDAVVFNEYNQWSHDRSELVKVTKALGVKAYGYLVMERFSPEQTVDYDRIIAPTVSFLRSMRAYKIRHFTHVPFSIDLKEFPKPENKKESVVKELNKDKFTFFHPGGWGGVQNRKNTDVVIEAFESMAQVNDCKLVITSQKELQFSRELHPNIEIINKDLSRKELIDLFYKADTTVLPSKWETIGIPILESLAAGTPVIVSNVPPMNEFIQDCMNGFTCSVNMATYPNIAVYAAEADVSSLKTKMENSLNPATRALLRKNSRHVAEEIYDLEKNKHKFLYFLNKDLDGEQ